MGLNGTELWEYLETQRGPQRLPLNIALPLTVINGLIFITGLVGNVSVCVVIVRHHSMHTATNYYLFSLAVSDLTLLLFGLPNDLMVYWHQYPWTLGVWFCKFRALLSESANYVSVLTIVAFSMERYLAICHPLHQYTMSGLHRAVRIIAGLWIVSLISAVPFAVFTVINCVAHPDHPDILMEESSFCGMLHQPDGWPLYEISSIVFFLTPMLVMVILYARMGFRIRQRTRFTLGKGVKGSVHGENRQMRSRRAVIRMLAAVVIAFFICWAPFHAQRLLYVYGQNSPHYHIINEWMFYITGLLYYISSTVNPILYNLMSNRYRIAFKETLWCGRGATSRHQEFVRDQSSFRETSVHSRCFDDKQLVRIRSGTVKERLVRYPRSSTAKNSVQWEEQDKNLQDSLLLPSSKSDETMRSASDVVIMLTPTKNGKPKCYAAENPRNATSNPGNDRDALEEKWNDVDGSTVAPPTNGTQTAAVKNDENCNSASTRETPLR